MPAPKKPDNRQFPVTNFLLRSFDGLKNSDNLRTMLKVMAVINRDWHRLRSLVIGSPEEKVRKEAADLLAQLQEAREKPQFVLLDKEGRRLMKASVALLGKLGQWDPHDKKMTETINAIMDHMSALAEQSK